MGQDLFVVSNSAVPLWVALLSAAPYFAVALLWLTLAAIVATRGDHVDKPNRMAQLYAYSVCLVAIVVALFSLSAIVEATFDRANPLQAEDGFGFGPALTSFEAYKATHRREQAMFGRGDPVQPDTTSEATLRQRYDALVSDRRASVSYRTSKSLVTNALLLLMAGGLFVFHWRWVRRLNGSATVAA